MKEKNKQTKTVLWINVVHVSQISNITFYCFNDGIHIALLRFLPKWCSCWPCTQTVHNHMQESVTIATTECHTQCYSQRCWRIWCQGWSRRPLALSQECWKEGDWSRLHRAQPWDRMGGQEPWLQGRRGGEGEEKQRRWSWIEWRNPPSYEVCMRVCMGGCVCVWVCGCGCVHMRVYRQCSWWDYWTRSIPHSGWFPSWCGSLANSMTQIHSGGHATRQWVTHSSEESVVHWPVNMLYNSPVSSGRRATW